MKCEYFQRNNKCYYGKKDGIHVGTKDKLDILENYITAWMMKILQANYNGRTYSGVVFIDCMCSSGMYIDDDNQVVTLGTSIRAAKRFITNKKNRFNDKDFTLILNDIDHDSVLCQKCRIEGLNDHDLISSFYYEKDVSKFLTDETVFNHISKDNHVLLFYDPYAADIRWNEIKTFIEELNNRHIRFDIILTHFHQNDTQRALYAGNRLTNPLSILKYEQTYLLSIDELYDALDKLDSVEKSLWFRDRIIHIMSNQLGLNINQIAYAPIFNSMNKDVYDIVCYSKSMKGKLLFKQVMFDNNKEDKKTQNGYQVKALFDFDDEETNYLQDRKEHSEKYIYYSLDHYARTIAKKFNKKNYVTFQELKNYLDNHPYINFENTKIELYNLLKKNHNVIISTGKIEDRILDFSNAEFDIVRIGGWK